MAMLRFKRASVGPASQASASAGITIADGTVLAGTLVWCVRDDGSSPFCGRICAPPFPGLDVLVPVRTPRGLQLCAASALYARPWRWFAPRHSLT